MLETAKVPRVLQEGTPGSLIDIFMNDWTHVGFTGLHKKQILRLIFHCVLIHRPSTKWWALWSWWRWTRMVWHQSRGWTRSSAKWIRTTTTRSRWRSSKRRRRATRPSCSCCSVTCRSEPHPPTPCSLLSPSVIHTHWTAAHVLMSH